MNSLSILYVFLFYFPNLHIFVDYNSQQLLYILLEQFKRVSAAHSVLANEKERKLYDLDLSEENTLFRQATGRTHDYHAGYDTNHRRSGRARGPTAHAHVRGIPIRPGLILLGVGIGLYSFDHLKNTLIDQIGGGSGGVISRAGMTTLTTQLSGEQKLVQAWKNPKSGSWETPAPWDPVYRRLKPELKMMPRDHVQRRDRG